MVVVFHHFKKFQIVLRPTRVDFQLVENRFFLFPASSGTWLSLAIIEYEQRLLYNTCQADSDLGTDPSFDCIILEQQECS